MKKADVKIGGKYYANVSGNRVEIRIDAENPRGGWEATNQATGKKIHIKTAQRLLGAVGTRRGRAKVTTEGDTAVVENEPATVETVTAPVEGVPKKPRKAKPEAADTAEKNEAGEKKLSCVSAALKVLIDRGEPMNTQELITAMTDQGLWASPGGKTPHATLYSAILRDLGKGDDSRFIKAERGRFAARA